VRRLSLCVIAILAASVAVGCDPGFGVWFRNDSNAPVIVQFIQQDGQYGTGFAVDAKSIGGSYLGLGTTTWSSHVRVVASEDCKLLWERHVDASPSGVVLVDASGAVSLVTSGPETKPAASEVPIPAVTETKKCLPKGVEFSPLNG
jgi:hypothetical protein